MYFIVGCSSSSSSSSSRWYYVGAYGSGDRGSIPGRVVPKTQKNGT